jgi:dipeptidyl aminopeptidase/acylaminoacyl peptidase
MPTRNVASVARSALVLALLALTVAGDASSSARTRCPGPTGFAALTYVKAGALIVLDMPACSSRVLVPRGAEAPVRWSADGRYIAFSGGVVAADGGRVLRGLSGVWAPRGHTLATITARGGVVLREPEMPARRLLPDGFGAQSLAFDLAGRLLAVSRARFHPPVTVGATATASRRQLWVLDVRTGARRLVYRPPEGNDRTPMVSGWAPGGHVIFTLPLLPALSANIDGVSVYAVGASGGRARRIVPAALRYEEFFSLCGARMALAAGLDRVTTRLKSIVVAGPPLWRARGVSRDRARSWVAPACSRDGRSVAASAGPNRLQRRFGLERRSIWLLSLDGRTRRRLTSPPPQRSDELPRWTAGGRGLLFFRTGPTKSDTSARGFLYVVGLDGRAAGPLADLGPTGNYYGHYGWAQQTDLFVPTAN